MENNKLDVVVDGIIYESQSKGGISRLFNEIFLRMCEADDTLHITLLTGGRLRQVLPQHLRITHRSVPNIARFLRPNRVWHSVWPHVRHFMCDLWAGTGEGKIWHSTYYTMPDKWVGRSVVTIHDMVFELFPQFYDELDFDSFRRRKRLSIQRADAVICVSDTTRRDVFRLYGLDADKVHVVPNAYSDIFRWVDCTDLPESIQIEQPFLLYVGNRARYKNFDVLAKAYSLWHRRKEVALVLVGGRSVSKSEQRLMEELDIAKQVKLLRDIDDETLCRLYNRALGFVYPSVYEGFGMPLLEAMACGCPVIASRIPSTIEVAGDCPVYFETGKIEDLLRAFDVILSEGRDSERVRAGLEMVKSYSWDKTAAQTLEVYRAIGTNK
jgi:glycosyltransferase involved in cell wall biosynthesis